jgi:hypothetical protein
MPPAHKPARSVRGGVAAAAGARKSAVADWSAVRTESVEHDDRGGTEAQMRLLVLVVTSARMSYRGAAIGADAPRLAPERVLVERDDVGVSENGAGRRAASS